MPAAAPSFDDIVVDRRELAREYLALLAVATRQPLALFAPRRVGKTFFLDRDLMPEAERAGYRSVYVDVWLHRAAPLSAINHALEEALDDASVPAGRAGKVGRTPVRKVGALGASVELGDEPQRRMLPPEPQFRFDALVPRLAAATRRHVLLVLDELQAVSYVRDGADVLASIRAVLQKHRKVVSAVFTGSSQEHLAAMLLSAGGPMYQFAHVLSFPPLGTSYLCLLQQHFHRVHRDKRLELAALERMFAFLGHRPALMRDLVKTMSAEGLTDVDRGFEQYRRDERQVEGFRGLLVGLAPLERAVLALLARGRAPFAHATVAELATLPGVTHASKSSVQRAIERLQGRNILARHQRDYRFDDVLFLHWLRETDLAKVFQ